MKRFFRPIPLLMHIAVSYVSIALAVPSVYPSVTTKTIAPGIILTEEIDSDPPLIIHVLNVDLTTPGIHLEVIPGQDTVTGPTGDIKQGREEVREITSRHSAVAGVNGDYFPFTGDPLGAAVWNGNIYSEPYPNRYVMGVEQDGHTLLFDTIGFLGELQSQQNELTAITGIDRMVSSTDTSDLVVFTPTFGPRSGIRPGCVEVILTGVNLPLRPSKLEIGTVAEVNPTSPIGSAIPHDGVILSALPGGQAGTFLANNLHVGDKAEFVCAIAPQASLLDGIRLSFLPRDSTDEPVLVGQQDDRSAGNWASVSEVIGGGPHLIVNGLIEVDGSQEGFTDSFVNNPNPRTAVGETIDGKLILVTVDGRQQLSKGVSLSDLAKIMVRYGAFNAMNLDGGGSTTMAVNNMIENSLASTGVERPVANALCVFSSTEPPPTDTPPTSDPVPTTIQPGAPAASAPQLNSTVAVSPTVTAVISGVPPLLNVGQIVQLKVVDGKLDVPGASASILWGGSVGSGIAYVNQLGILTTLTSGQGMVQAVYKGRLLQEEVTVAPTGLPPLAPVITGSFNSTQSKHSRFVPLVVGVFSPSGMPVPGTVVHVEVTKGKPGATNLTTDVDGYADTNITWTSKSGTVTLSAPNCISADLNEQ